MFKKVLPLILTTLLLFNIVASTSFAAFDAYEDEKLNAHVIERVLELNDATGKVDEDLRNQIENTLLQFSKEEKLLIVDEINSLESSKTLVAKQSTTLGDYKISNSAMSLSSTRSSSKNIIFIPHPTLNYIVLANEIGVNQMKAAVMFGGGAAAVGTAILAIAGFVVTVNAAILPGLLGGVIIMEIAVLDYQIVSGNEWATCVF